MIYILKKQVLLVFIVVMLCLGLIMMSSSAFNSNADPNPPVVDDDYSLSLVDIEIEEEMKFDMSDDDNNVPLDKDFTVTVENAGQQNLEDGVNLGLTDNNYSTIYDNKNIIENTSGDDSFVQTDYLGTEVGENYESYMIDGKLSAFTSDKSVHVTVDGENKFESEVRMVVESIDENFVIDAIDGRVRGINSISAVDITFLNSNNQVVEPSGDVIVSVEMNEANSADKYMLVHITDDGEAFQIADNRIKSMNDKKVVFLAKSFSVYALLSINNEEEMDLSDDGQSVYNNSTRGTFKKAFSGSESDDDLKDVSTEENNISKSYIYLSEYTYTYSGDEKKPDVIVEYDGEELTPNKDYVWEYGNNVNAGNYTAFVHVSGIGDYSGEKYAYFSILKKQLEYSISIDNDVIRAGEKTSIEIYGWDSNAELVYSSDIISLNLDDINNDGSVRGVITALSEGETTISIKPKDEDNCFIYGGRDILVKVVEAYMDIEYHNNGSLILSTDADNPVLTKLVTGLDFNNKNPDTVTLYGKEYVLSKVYFAGEGYGGIFISSDGDELDLGFANIVGYHTLGIRNVQVYTDEEDYDRNNNYYYRRIAFIDTEVLDAYPDAGNIQINHVVENNIDCIQGVEYIFKPTVSGEYIFAVNGNGVIGLRDGDRIIHPDTRLLKNDINAYSYKVVGGETYRVCIELSDPREYSTYVTWDAWKGVNVDKKNVRAAIFEQNTSDVDILSAFGVVASDSSSNNSVIKNNPSTDGDNSNANTNTNTSVNNSNSSSSFNNSVDSKYNSSDLYYGGSLINRSMYGTPASYSFSLIDNYDNDDDDDDESNEIGVSGDGTSFEKGDSKIAGSSSTRAVYKKTGDETVRYEDARLATTATTALVPKKVSIDGKKYKVTSIADGAFLMYSKLNSVTVGKNVRKIESGAFEFSSQIKSLTVNSKKLKAESVKGAFIDSNISTIYTHASNVSYYKDVFTKKNTGSKKEITVKQKVNQIKAN